ncbi:hypothetical protein V6N12_057114 [Hibiscus sabdariffa]|uniref:Uncharacterized protein n=1 Tax=Hibiscus sabdariffa TaxID=183260 RepID=A0ABR2AUU4_9ROSI
MAGFSEDAKPQQLPQSKANVQSVRTRNGHSNKHSAQATSGSETWGFGTDNFTAAPAASSQRLKATVSEGSSSQRSVGQYAHFSGRVRKASEGVNQHAIAKLECNIFDEYHHDPFSNLELKWRLVP